MPTLYKVAFQIGFLLVCILAQSVKADELGVVQSKYVTVNQERVVDAVIEAVNQATISAQTTGRVEKLNFDVDDTVQKGDVLVEFRNRTAKAALNAASANFSEAEKEYQRIKGIYEKKLVAKSVLDKAEARFKSTKARFEQAKEAMEDTIIRAPYSGIVVKRHIEVGELAQPGRRLMTGLSLEALRVSVNVPQDMIHAVRTFKTANILFFNKKSVTSTELRISPYADETSHSFQVKVTIPKGDYGVYPGMSAKVSFVVGSEKRLLVSDKAVTQRSEVSAVYVKDENGKLHFRQVRVGAYIPSENAVEILAGLEEGETVMLDPVYAAAALKKQGQ